MTDDYKVDGRSAKDIAAITLAWRDTLGVADQWAPSVVTLLELRVPRVIKNFALDVVFQEVVHSALTGEAEVVEA